MQNNQKRWLYIDVAKGLLILFVVLGHLRLMCRVCYGITAPGIDIYSKLSDIWSIFFMPAFFFINGYCSNFNTSFKVFFIKSFKGIILPALFINTFINIYDFLGYAPSFSWALKTYVKQLFFSITGEWFLPTLFFSRILFYMLNKVLKNRKYQLLISLLFFLIGITLYNSFTDIKNLWYFKHVLISFCFVVIGNIARSYTINKRFEILSSIIYWGILIIFFFFKIDVPYLANVSYIPYKLVIIFFFMAVLGTIMILYISKYISSTSLPRKIFSFLGKNSLVIYLIHFPLYRIFIYIYSDYFNIENNIGIVLFMACTIISVILLSSFVAILLNTKYFKWILGKF